MTQATTIAHLRTQMNAVGQVIFKIHGPLSEDRFVVVGIGDCYIETVYLDHPDGLRSPHINQPVRFFDSESIIVANLTTYRMNPVYAKRWKEIEELYPGTKQG